jgi:hypothetical protein
MLTRARRQGGQGPTSPGGPPTAPPPGLDAGAVFSTPYWAQRTAAAVEPALSGVGRAASARVRAQVRAPAFAAGSTAAVANLIRSRTEFLAQRINGTTANQITKALAEGWSAGEGQDKLATRVRAVFKEATKNRARTIARTEVIGASNASAQTYAENLPPGIVGRKKWLAHNDQRTRHDHREMLSHPAIPLNQHYTVPPSGEPVNPPAGKPYTAMFPHDPDLPPGETINCRCNQLFLPPERA